MKKATIGNSSVKRASIFKANVYNKNLLNVLNVLAQGLWFMYNGFTFNDSGPGPKKRFA